MLDIAFIREERGRVQEAITEKGVSVDLDALFALDDTRRELVRVVNDLNRRRNEIAGSGGKPSGEAIEEGKKLKAELAEQEAKLGEVEKQFTDMMLRVPNVYAEGTPLGADDRSNVEVRRVGSPTSFSFEPRDHVALAESLDLLDTERGTKVAGFRGYFLKNQLAELQWAVLSYAIKIMTTRGFTLFIPPTMVREKALVGSGHFPALREESYAVDDNFLVGTSEPSLLAYRSDEMLSADELPLRYCAVSPCYRREVGSYGKDTKGIYRVHEFWKVEQVVICENDLDASMDLFHEILSISEDLLKGLELPYRVVQVCTGDMGAGKYTMYDIETWMPSRNGYGETHSCSHFTDWQPRRLNIRYKKSDGSIVYPYAMNNTVVASPRILIAILENYQRSDGTIGIPRALQPFMGATEIRGQ